MASIIGQERGPQCLFKDPDSLVIRTPERSGILFWWHNYLKHLIQQAGGRGHCNFEIGGHLKEGVRRRWSTLGIELTGQNKLQHNIKEWCWSCHESGDTISSSTFFNKLALEDIAIPKLVDIWKRVLGGNYQIHMTNLAFCCWAVASREHSCSCQQVILYSCTFKVDIVLEAWNFLKNFWKTKTYASIKI